MDDMYQYAASAVDHNNPGTTNALQEEDDPLLQAFNNFGWSTKFSKLVDTVKKQSEAIVQVTRNDLQEFASVLREDVENLSGPSEEGTVESDAPRSFAPFAALRERLGTINTLNFNTLRTGLSDTLSQSLPSQLTSVTLPDNISVGQLQQELDQGTRFAEQYMQNFGAEIIRALSNAITVLEPDSEDENKAEDGTRQNHSATRIFANRKDARMAEIRNDRNTFLKNPSETLTEDDEQGKKGLETFDAGFNVQDYTDEIAQLLEEFPDLRDMMDTLVPVEVSYATFWQRYFYHTSKLEQEELARQLITKGIEEQNKEEEFKWDSDDDEPVSSEKPEPIKEETSSKPTESDGDYSNISEPGSTEASLVSPVLKSQADGDDWVKAEKRKEAGNHEESDSDWE